ncbi:hypothetical protein [Bradyrhizobium sp. Cp5.3]|uniref:hypothetical protein n=1 Tax=Bradyrhizobium sp. Cp5.3 TaxID=443598 RepID=UPI0003FE6AFA|nr:hypothetical protein [Bradyrhizobium sp. Cp5.3]
MQSGEIIISTKFQQSGGPTPDAGQGGQGGTGQQIYFKKDGSLTVTDGSGATYLPDGAGNIKVTAKTIQYDCQTFTLVASGDVGIKGSGNVEVKSGGKLGLDAGGAVVVQGHGDVCDGSVTPPSDQPPIDPFEVLR